MVRPIPILLVLAITTTTLAISHAQPPERERSRDRFQLLRELDRALKSLQSSPNEESAPSTPTPPDDHPRRGPIPVPMTQEGDEPSQRERIGHLLQAIQHLQKAGERDLAREVEHHIRKPKRGDRDEPHHRAKPPENPEQEQIGHLHMAVKLLDQAGADELVEQLEREIQVRQSLKYLHAAAEHLKQGGKPELAEELLQHVRREREQMEQQARHGERPSHPEREPLSRHVHELHEQLHDLKKEVHSLKERLGMRREPHTVRKVPQFVLPEELRVLEDNENSQEEQLEEGPTFAPEVQEGDDQAGKDSAQEGSTKSGEAIEEATPNKESRNQ